MKKNKKLFAILTLVAFMMTLVPALAFAAPTGSEKLSVEKAADGTLTFTITDYTASELYIINDGADDVANAVAPNQSTQPFAITGVAAPATTTEYELKTNAGTIGQGGGVKATFYVGNTIENATATLKNLSADNTTGIITVAGLKAGTKYNITATTFIPPSLVEPVVID